MSAHSSQQIQEAYRGDHPFPPTLIKRHICMKRKNELKSSSIWMATVLSDGTRKILYDSILYDPPEEHEKEVAVSSNDEVCS